MSDSLGVGEPHPSAIGALEYIRDRIRQRPLLIEAFSSVALEGSRHAEVCWGTLKRLLDGDPVSDRYILGLAWAIRETENQKKEQTQ